MKRMQTMARPKNTTNKSRRVRHIYGVESYDYKRKEHVTVTELDGNTVIIKTYNAFNIIAREKHINDTQSYFSRLLHSDKLYTIM